MKTAKEWAAEMAANLREDEGKWYADVLRGIIERLVERVQADARAPDAALVDALRAIETRDDSLCADATARDLASHLYVYGATSSEIERGGAGYVARVMLEALANLGHRQKLAREIVERQRDEAQAEVEKLRAENDRLNAEHVDYLAFIADQNDMRAEEHDQIRKANQ